MLEIQQVIAALRRDPTLGFKALSVDILDVGVLKIKDRLFEPAGSVFRQVVSFTNSWVNAGGGYYDAAYRKDVQGIVYLRGRLMSGTVGSAAFTLPPSFRPLSTLAFAVVSNAAAGLVEISSAGVVTPKSPSNNTYVSLDNISFLAEA